MADLLSNPNFLSLLAGVGAGFDPQGFAGRLGGAVQQGVQSQAAQRALAGQEEQRKIMSGLLVGSMLPEDDPRKKQFLDRALKFLGGMTGPDQEGVTSVKVGPKGNYVLDITPPQTPLNQQGPVSQEPGITSVPGTGTTPAQQPRRSTQLNALVPFYSAP